MKVAMLGSAPGWNRAPFTDPEWECWALNDQYQLLSPVQLSHVSRWFELHPDTENTRSRRPPDHWANLAALTIPVYAFHDLPGIAEVRRLDIPPLIAAGRDYFACTCAYQIAVALVEGATAIGLYGIQFTGAREAVVERPCVEWWLGLAEGRGIPVTIEHDCEYGLGRQRYRYADQDGEERLQTFTHVYQHFAGSLTWLIGETRRLMLAKTWDDD